MNNSEAGMIEAVAQGVNAPGVVKDVLFKDIGLKIGDRSSANSLEWSS